MSPITFRTLNAITYRKPSLLSQIYRTISAIIFTVATLCGIRAAVELDRKAYGFEISKEFYRRAKNEMLNIQFLPTVLNF